MAETIVSFAISKLVQLANTEANLAESLPGEIRSISNELQSIKAILKDAERKAEEADDIKEWVRQVRELAYQIEDVVDEYLFLKQQSPSRDEEGGGGRCFGTGRLFDKVTRCFSQIKPKHELAVTIKRIKDEIVEINTRRERYQFITTERPQQEPEGNDIRWQDIRAQYVDDSGIVGAQGPKTDVCRLLKHSPLVAIVGMGGLGKSTLARQVYDQETQCFDYYAWLTVSQSYPMVDLLKSLYKQFREAASEEFDMNHMDDRLQDLQLITNELRNFLSTAGSYFVVLDDVWEEGSLAECIRAVLPATNAVGRILLTTRDEDIAASWTATFWGTKYQLSDDVAWQLFCNKIFVNGKCPAELSSLAEDIVRRCEGLPLVLVAVGGLLSTKGSKISEWRKLRDNLGSEFARNRHLKSSTKILLLSYQELPYYLKLCFLYFGMFPEGYSIDCMRLVRLWMAEGFIESFRGMTLEEVALEYLTALVKRNLVQVSQRDDVTGIWRSLRVHDLLREIILSKLEESGFSQVMAKHSLRMNTHFRRLSIQYCFDEAIQICSPACSIRSLLVFDNQQMSSLLTGSQQKLFRFLRVLDLQMLQSVIFLRRWVICTTCTF